MPKPASDPVLIMTPPPWRLNTGTANLVMANEALRWLSTTSVHCSSLSLSTGLPARNPALLTRMSRRP
jgi:hypothetical protein